MSCLLVFPGQGAQQPGMLHALAQATPVKACLEEAADVLGEDVLALDNASALLNTRNVQLCLLIAGVASARLLLQDAPPPAYVAGLSIGAYPAAVIAGALGFADALKLVRLRGELMQQAYPHGYGMTAIVGLEPVTLEPLLARVNSARSPVYLANINADKQVVIAGSDDAMRAVAELARQGVAVQVKRLAVSVPSHCALLEQPARKLAQAFAKVTLQAPVLGYLSGSSARRLVKAEQLRDDLANNMCRLIDWRATVQSAWERGVRLQIEMPPGTVLTGLARKVLEPGTAIAYAGARLDTLQALMKQEEYRDP